MTTETRNVRWFATLHLDDVPLVGGKNASLGEQRDIVMVETGEEPAQFVFDARCGERVAVGSGGQREAFGYSNPFEREHRIELAERGSFAANFGDVAQPDIAKPADIGLCRHWIHSLARRV